MDPNQFDSVIAGLTELGARIEAINARPFMPDLNMTLSRALAKTRPLAPGKLAKPAKSARPHSKTMTPGSGG